MLVFGGGGSAAASAAAEHAPGLVPPARAQEYVMLDEEGVVRSRVQQNGLKVKWCIFAAAVISFVFVLAGVVLVVMFVNEAAAVPELPCPPGMSQTECAAQLAAAELRTSNVTAHKRVQVVLGNGCFWERQYAYAMLEYSNSLFARGLYVLVFSCFFFSLYVVGVHRNHRDTTC